jgi:hypothetical protein
MLARAGDHAQLEDDVVEEGMIPTSPSSCAFAAIAAAASAAAAAAVVGVDDDRRCECGGGEEVDEDEEDDGGGEGGSPLSIVLDFLDMSQGPTKALYPLYSCKPGQYSPFPVIIIVSPAHATDFSFIDARRRAVQHLCLSIFCIGGDRIGVILS